MQLSNSNPRRLEVWSPTHFAGQPSRVTSISSASLKRLK
jgi:hypothetical protein